MDFVFYDDDWLRREFERLEFVRSHKYLTFKAALNLLHQRRPAFFNIVETGTMRLHDDPGGCSTLLFGAYCARYNGHLTTVDNSLEHMETSKEETSAYASRISYVVEDSIEFLRSYGRPIDLLYLDSMDCDPIGDSSQAQIHQLKEFEVTGLSLGEGSVLLMDDNNFLSGGKTRMLKKVLPERGWECVLDEGQSLWQRKRQ